MYKTTYNVEIADNGIIIRSDASGCVSVREEKGDTGEYDTYLCYKECIANEIAPDIATLIFDETIEKGEKKKFKIKIEII